MGLADERGGGEPEIADVVDHNVTIGVQMAADHDADIGLAQTGEKFGAGDRRGAGGGGCADGRWRSVLPARWPTAPAGVAGVPG